MDYFKLAQVLKPQGIKGEVKLKAFVDDLSRFENLPHIFLKKDGAVEKRAVTSSRVYKQFAYIKFEGCDDRNAAERFRNHFLYIDREHAAKLPEGAHYIADLIGLEVKDESGTLIGVLQDVLQTGGVDVYCLQAEDGQLLFPLAPGVVLKKDVEGGEIVVSREKLEEVMVHA